MLESTFFKQKPARALAALVDKSRVWYPSLLCKQIDCTYPHMSNTLRNFEEDGLIVSHGEGRIRVIKLTPKGEELAIAFDRMFRKMKRIERRHRVENKKEKA